MQRWKFGLLAITISSYGLGLNSTAIAQGIPNLSDTSGGSITQSVPNLSDISGGSGFQSVPDFQPLGGGSAGVVAVDAGIVATASSLQQQLNQASQGYASALAQFAQQQNRLPDGTRRFSRTPSGACGYCTFVVPDDSAVQAALLRLNQAKQDAKAFLSQLKPMNTDQTATRGKRIW